MSAGADVDVRLAQAEDAPPIVSVSLPAQLTEEAARIARDRVSARVDQLGERGFALLVDLRAVERGEPTALERLRELESIAAKSGRLVRLAHLVASEEQVARSRAQLEQIGMPELFRDFTDPRAAVAYLAATKPSRLGEG